MATQHALALPEIVHEIFSWLQKQTLESEQGLGCLLICARVNHTWHHIATQTIWRDVPMLSYVFTRYVRKSPNRQALANCVRYATYHTPEIQGPRFRKLEGGGFRRLVENRWLNGLKFSKLHTLTIQIPIRNHRSWSAERSDFYWYGYISDIHLLPLIKCPALSKLVLWHMDCTIGVLPEIWMSYMRRILGSPS